MGCATTSDRLGAHLVDGSNEHLWVDGLGQERVEAGVATGISFGGKDAGRQGNERGCQEFGVRPEWRVKPLGAYAAAWQ